MVIRKPSNLGQQGKRIPSWMSEHPVFCCIRKRPHDDHRYSVDPFGAHSHSSKLFLKRPTSKRERSRKTPESMGARFFIASTAFRAYRNRHLEVRHSKHAPRVRGIINLKIHCSIFRKPVTVSVGPLIVPNLMIHLFEERFCTWP